MEGENELFWLTEAEILRKLVTNAQRMRVVTETRQENREV
jgi:hypothetical protein